MASEQMIKPRSISGFPEWLPEQQRLQDRWMAAIRHIFQSYGYEHIETAAVELTEVLAAKGVEQKEIYSLTRLQAEEQEDIISRLLEYTRHDGNFTEEYILARDDEQAPDYGERAINLALENEVADTEVNRYAEYLRTLELGTDEYIRARDNLLFALYFSGRITSDVLLAQHSNPEAARDYCGI